MRGQMTSRLGRRAVPVVAPMIVFLLLGADVARAEIRYIHFDDDVRWTLIWCAIILAGGMIGAALILRRPR